MTCCSRHLLPRYVHHHAHSHARWGGCFSLCFMCAAFNTRTALLHHCSGLAYSIPAPKVDADCSHAVWVAFTQRFPETIHKILSHLGRSWNFIDYDCGLWPLALLFCRRTVEWQWEGRKCLWPNSRHLRPRKEQYEGMTWLSVRDSNVLSPEYET